MGQFIFGINSVSDGINTIVLQSNNVLIIGPTGPQGIQGASGFPSLYQSMLVDNKTEKLSLVMGTATSILSSDGTAYINLDDSSTDGEIMIVSDGNTYINISKTQEVININTTTTNGQVVIQSSLSSILLDDLAGVNTNSNNNIGLYAPKNVFVQSPTMSMLTGVIDMKSHKIVDLGNGSNPADAVNYSQLIGASMSGPQGPIGPTGAAGSNGTIGVNGATGATGSAGSNGATGATGSDGSNGATGDTGGYGLTYSGLTNSVAYFNGATSLTSSTLLSFTTTQGLSSRITKRVVSTSSTTNAVINIDTTDVYYIYALSTGVTFSSPTYSNGPTEAQPLTIRIKDNGSTQSLFWVTGVTGSFRSGSDLALPTSTIPNKTIYAGLLYNDDDSRYDLVALINNI